MTPEKAQEIVEHVRGGARYKHAVELAGVPLHEANRYRRKGLINGDEDALRFHIEIVAIEAEAIVKAEKALQAICEGRRLKSKVATRQEARGQNVQLQAIKWFLEKRCPEEYGHIPVAQLRREIAAELIEHLAQHLPGDIFDAVVDALAYSSSPALESGEP